MDVHPLTFEKNSFLQQLTQLTQSLLEKTEDACLLPEIRLFSEEFYEQYPLHELESRDLNDTVGMLLSAYRFVKNNDVTQANVRVFNPSEHEDYWQCKHTVILIHAENMPFLTDSVRIAPNKSGLNIHAIKNTTLITERDAQGALTQLTPASDAYHLDGNELLIYLEVSLLSTANDLKRIASAIRDAIMDVAVVNKDHMKMLDKAQAIRNQVDCAKHSYSSGEVNQVNEFVAWLIVNNFTFLGYAYYSLSETQQCECTESFGLLKMDKAKAFIGDKELKKSKGDLLTFGKSPNRSTVHRRAYPEHIIVKQFNEKGDRIGEHHLIGLYTSVVYRASVLNIPIVREKVEALYSRLNLNFDSYNGKMIRQVLETYPRDELFQTSVNDLTATISGIAQINERQQVRLFMRKSPWDNFVYAISYIPRDIFSTRIREKIVELLSDAVGAESHEFYTYYSESTLSQTYFVFRLRDDQHERQWDVKALEHQVQLVTQSWRSLLKEQFREALGMEQGNNAFQRFKAVFPVSYQENSSVEEAVSDCEQITALSDQLPLVVKLCVLLIISLQRTKRGDYILNCIIEQRPSCYPM